MAGPSESVTGAPATTPSSTETPTSPATGSESGGNEGGFDFSSIFESGEPTAAPSATPLTEAPVAPAAPAQAQPPAAQPAVAPAPAQAPPVQQSPQVSGQQGTAPQQTPSSPPLNPADPIALAEGLQTHEAVAIDHLANTVFRLDPKDLEALESDVAGTVPKLLAKAVVFTQQQTLRQLGRLVPAMIGQYVDSLRRHSSNEERFWSAWPSLDRQKHGAMVTQLAQRYRGAFPDTTLEQMIEQIGPLALSAAGLPIAAMTRTGTPVSASAPAVKANGSRPAAFVPAAPGTVAQQQVPNQANPFDYMGQVG